MINVLVIDDDAMVAELNRAYIGQIPGFACCGSASTLKQAQEYINAPDQKIDLILLDVYMQQDNGLSLLPMLRENNQSIDVIVISSASDFDTIQKSLHYGVVDYLIKPFQFARFEEALTLWRDKRALIGGQKHYQQADVDRLLHGSYPTAVDASRLPKGLTAQTLRTICRWIDEHQHEEFSTDELAMSVNISRVSCRKYLIWLDKVDILYTRIHYGVTGRPVYRYRLQLEHTELLKQFCQ